MVLWRRRCPVAWVEAQVAHSPFNCSIFGAALRSVVTYKETTFLILSSWGTARDIGSETQGPLEDGLGTSLFSWSPPFRCDYVYFSCLIVAGLLFIFLFLPHCL